jgi:hypothetical protein
MKRTAFPSKLAREEPGNNTAKADCSFIRMKRLLSPEAELLRLILALAQPKVNGIC